ncbi:MAG: AAA family ATPase [Desulfobacterales bacterium]|nr:AAA family ATPase [Desulfobacterales bacterium]
MEKFSDYKILEKLDETRSSIVYRGQKDNDAQTVVIKVFKAKQPSSSEIARFRQEYEIIKNLDIEGVVKTYSLIEHISSLSLILEDFEAVSLKEILKKETIDIQLFLEIAIKLSDTLGNIHKKNIVHKDIKPHNILVGKDYKTIKITDFGISKILTHESEEIYNKEVIEGTLLYMSPEQTGRMNRYVDYRTDFYSLGVTFYEMLTSIVPFRSNDPLEILHSHIAKQAVPPHKLNQSIPKIISDIILKLMSKTAEERYQNAFGLLTDLTICRDNLEGKGRIDVFELAQNDISLKFCIPQKLFGREKEIASLMESFERVSHNGISEMLLVSGYPGIGKSALIKEIHKPVVAKRGYFILGKYDQFGKDIPYKSIIQAFQSLVRQILSESKEKIDEWKDNIVNVLSPNGRIITDIFPDVEFIIGKQPDVPKLGPEETQNRFNIYLKKFIQLFGTNSHPLVLFLDDLQWADLASLNLIKMLMTDPDTRYLLLIGAYRNNEVDKTHILFSNIKSDDIINNINEINLSEIDLNSVNQLIANCLRCTHEDSSPLADLVHEKTRGNPFFVNQFLTTLYEEKKITLEQSIEYRGWKWDIKEIRKMKVTDNVVELMAGKISGLTVHAQDILKIGACIGNKFDLKTISIVTEKSVDAILSDMSEAFDAGLLYFELDMCHFSHDRIQEAAYSLLPEKEKELLHYKIGSYLLNISKDDDLIEHVFNITNQLNFGINLIESDEKRDRLSELNLLSGKKAKSSAAYKTALAYIKTGIWLLPEHPWQSKYDLTLSLYNEGAEAAFLSGDFDHVENYTAIVLKNAVSVLDKVSAYNVIILSLYAQNQPHKCIQKTCEVLNLLGVKIPLNVSSIRIAILYQRVIFALFQKNDEKLLNLPSMQDKYALAASRIAASGGPSFLAIKNIMPGAFLVCKMTMLNICYGNSPESPFWYSLFAAIMCDFGKIEKANQLARIAIALSENTERQYMQCRSIANHNIFVSHSQNHLRNTLGSLLHAFRIGIQQGDLDYLSRACCTYCWYNFLCGYNLSEIEKHMHIYSSVVFGFKQELVFQYIQVLIQATRNLQGFSKDPTNLTGKFYNEADDGGPLVRVNESLGCLFFYYHKMVIFYLFEKKEQALEAATLARSFLMSAISAYFKTIFCFYRSLISLSLISDVNTSKAKKTLKQVVNRQKQIKKWAHHAPMNYKHKYHLIEAEIARVRGDELAAIQLYEEAIKGACENEYIQEQALAYELAAKFYLNRGFDDIAATYMTNAHSCYSKWGAFAKTKHLEENYPKLIKKDAKESVAESVSSTGTVSDALDLATIMKSTRAISSEFAVKKLLTEMMKISIECAGAQKIIFILEKDGKWFIEAKGSVESSEVEMAGVLLDETDDNVKLLIPLSVTNFVLRTKDYVNLDDAAVEGDFINDPYIIENKPRSILCTPLIYKENMIGISYLENRLVSGAFTEQRREVLTLLNAQSAISIENARMYNLIQEKEEKYRTIIENIEDGYFELNLKGDITFFNDSMCRISGFTSEEMMGTNYSKFLVKEDIQKTFNEFNKVYTTTIPSNGVSWQFIKKDGNAGYAEASISLITDAEGNKTGFRSIVRDITERKKAEEEIRKLNAELEKKVEERTKELNKAVHDLQFTLDELKQTQSQLMQSNSRIMKSISYAQVIQTAILPETEMMSQTLKDYFIIWKPKDVIGGDIFWFIASQDEFLLAVIDCTGHGIPGALMTMMTKSIIDRIVNENGMNNPALILHHLNIHIKHSLHQENIDAKSNDGMDISLCYVNRSNSSMKYAGTNLSLYYSLKGDVIELKGDKQSIGYKFSDIHFNYTNHVVQLDPAMQFYLTTDGLLDQVGNKTKFTFSKQRFKNFISQHYNKPLSEQKPLLIQMLEDYQGNEIQRDDITIIGFAV